MMKKLIIIFVLIAWGNQLWSQQINQLIFSKINGEYVLWNGDTIKTMGYTFTLNAPINIPSPTLSVKWTLWNKSQGAPHTIHLHGLDVDQQNDGVPHLSFEVEHDSMGHYYFVAPHAGTYIYHCHVASPVHVQAGMYGLLIVRPTDGGMKTWDNGYSYDSELAWLTSEVDTFWHHDSIINHEHISSQVDYEMPGIYAPQHFLVNGKSEQQLADSSFSVYGSANEIIYMRLANVGNYGNRVILPTALNARIIASDGRPLPTEELSDTVMIFPGERYGVLLEPTAEFTDSVKIEYFDLNTQIIANTQKIPVSIAGFFSIKGVELQSLKCTVFPNPAQDYLDVELTLTKNEAIQGK